MATGRLIRGVAFGVAVVIIGAVVGVAIGVLTMCGGDGPEFPY